MATSDPVDKLNPTARRFLDMHIRNASGQRAAPRIAVGRQAVQANPTQANPTAQTGNGAQAVPSEGTGSTGDAVRSQVDPVKVQQRLIRNHFNLLKLKYEEVLPQHTSTAGALKFVYNAAKAAVENEQWDVAAGAVKDLERAIQRPPPTRPQPSTTTDTATTRTATTAQGATSQVDPVKVRQRLIRNHFNLLQLKYQSVLPMHTSTAPALTAVYQKAKRAVDSEQWDIAARAVQDLDEAIRRPPPDHPDTVTRRFKAVEVEYRKVLPLHTITAGALTFHYDAAKIAMGGGRWDMANAALTDLEDAVKIPPLRPRTATPETATQKKEREAYESAYRDIDGAQRRVLAAAPKSQQARIGADFLKLPMPPAPLQIRDFNFKQALIDATPKLRKAEEVNLARDFDQAEPGVRVRIQKAALYAKQSGAMKGQETAISEIEEIVTRATEELEAGQHAEAIKLIKQAGALADAVAKPYEALVFIERSKAMFARAERALQQKDLWGDQDRRKQLAADYENLSKDHAEALTTDDHPRWESTAGAKQLKAKTIVEEARAKGAERWANDSKQKAANRRPVKGGLGDTLTTMPKFSALSEADKFDVMAVSLEYGKEALQTKMQEVYIAAQVQGVALSLSPAQVAAALGYSGTNFDDINGLLRGSADPSKFTAKKLDQIKVHIELLREALDLLPDYGTAGYPLFRWETPHGDSLQSRYSVGSEFEIKDFWSTGASGGSLVDAKKPPTAEILIWGKKGSKGKDISLLSGVLNEGGRSDGAQLKGQGGGEVLFPPGSRFRTEFCKAYDAANHEVDAETVKKELVRRDPRLPGSPVTFHYRIEVTEL
ncbi:MAG: hypothetical protein ABIS28_18360 [Caldimonas sp.]